MIGAAFAGLAGGLFGHYLMYLHTNSFTFMKSIEVVIMVVLGGMGSITGSIGAAIFLTILPEALRSVGAYRMVIYSLMLILLMIFRPQGIFGPREIGDSPAVVPVEADLVNAERILELDEAGSPSVG